MTRWRDLRIWTLTDFWMHLLNAPERPRGIFGTGTDLLDKK